MRVSSFLFMYRLCFKPRIVSDRSRYQTLWRAQREPHQRDGKRQRCGQMKDSGGTRKIQAKPDNQWGCCRHATG